MARDPDGIDRVNERRAMREIYDDLAEGLARSPDAGTKKVERLLARIARNRARLGPDDGQLTDLDAVSPIRAEMLRKIRASRNGVTPIDLDALEGEDANPA